MVMTGTLQEKKAKSGKTYYYAVVNIDGKMKWISTGLQTKGNKRAAQQKLQDILIQYNNTGSNKTTVVTNAVKEVNVKVEQITPLETAQNGQDILFCDWVRKWLDSRKIDVRDCTAESYETHAKAVLGYFDERKIRLIDISYSNIEEYCKYMIKEGKVDRYTGERTGYAIRTVRSQKFIIVSALNWAVKHKMIQSNPALGVTVSRKKNRQLARKPRFFTSEEANQYLQFLKMQEDVLYDMIYVTLVYGLRRSEALGLTEKAIDFERRKLYIRRTVVKMLSIHDEEATKTFDSEREYPLTDDMIEFFHGVIVKKRWERQFYGRDYKDTGFLFTWEDGRPFSPDYVSKHHKKMVAEFGRPDLTFHNLRHSTACILFERGWKAKDIQEWLGHADIITTMNIYTHIDRAHKQRQAESLDGVLNYEILTDSDTELYK